MDNEIKVLRFWTSPFCGGRVELALELKKLSYQVMDEDLPNKSKLLLDSNPIYKEVPVLLHNGKPVIGSLTIVEYIDETWTGTNPIMPTDPYEKARARFLAKFIDEKVIPVLRNSFWTEGDMQKMYMDQAKECLTILEKELGVKKYFGGDNIGYLDIAASYVAHWTFVFQEVSEVEVFNKDNFSVLWKWSQEFVNSDAAKRSLPAKEKLVEFFMPRKAYLKVAYVKPV